MRAKLKRRKLTGNVEQFQPKLTFGQPKVTKPSIEVSKQKEQLTGKLVQPLPKLKFGQPKSRSKFENFNHACPNQDPMAEIQSKRLDQKH